ncbi:MULTISPECIES: hypothetical protein [Pseudomonas]|uniref:Uncharacterized protein n=1 Tax=Pseudomonas putida S13.1.2 TaxID=1384061 RepID=A0AAU8RUE5_PSEPU|nr:MULTISPECIES: hypothetical protein [Pseudomonas]AJQ46895.1 hypothetical protein N805_06490 [Pseudomonas putida S13.1.2]MCS4064159.1 hypothetical protein [Pseudomonas putida]NQD54654.1 hypothetical protein [Pseudomonas sp. CM25]
MNEDELISRHHPVDEDMPMQHRVWRFERVGWYTLVLLVMLALAGLFGNGPLSDAQAVSTDGRIEVDYQRLSRTGSIDNLRITVRGAPGEQVIVLLGGTLLQTASIETMQPQPQMSRSHGEALLLELGTGKDGIATLYLTLRSEHVGILEGIVRAGQASAVNFSTFLYP